MQEKQLERFYIEYRVHAPGVDNRVRIINHDATSKLRVMAGVRSLYGSPRVRRREEIKIEFLEVSNHKELA